ncbi:hypothetical protein MTO96_009546 [Rhipicephalus appendiculatus]
MFHGRFRFEELHPVYTRARSLPRQPAEVRGDGTVKSVKGVSVPASAEEEGEEEDERKYRKGLSRQARRKKGHDMGLARDLDSLTAPSSSTS